MLLAVDGTPAATSTGSIILPRPTVRREALLRACHPFLVAGPLLRTNHRRYRRASKWVPTIGPTVPTTPSTGKARYVKRVTISEAWYIEPSSRVETGKAGTGVGTARGVRLFFGVLGLGGGARGGEGERDGGEEEEEEEERKGAALHRWYYYFFLSFFFCKTCAWFAEKGKVGLRSYGGWMQIVKVVLMFEEGSIKAEGGICLRSMVLLCQR